MPTRGEQIAQALDAFLQSCSDVEGAAVVSVDGLPMASALPMHVEEDRLAAMAAAMLSLGEKASEGLSRGRLQELHLEGAAGTVHLMAAGSQAVFCAICRDGAKTGLVLFEMATAADRIGAALAAPQVPAPQVPVPQPVAQATAPAHAAPRPAAHRPTEEPVPTPAAVAPHVPVPSRPGPAAVPAGAVQRPTPVPAPPEGAVPVPTPAGSTSATTAPTPLPVSPASPPATTSPLQG